MTAGRMHRPTVYGWPRAGIEMKPGDRVRASVSLPGMPAGAIGEVKEIGRRFIVVQFADGRMAYYSPQQVEPQTILGADAEDTALGFGEERVVRGSHVCLLPSSANDLREAMARYTAVGLQEGEKCLCVLPTEWLSSARTAMTRMGADLSGALDSRQVVLLTPREIYLGPSEFTAEKQLSRLRNLLASSHSKGAGRARLFGCPPWELLDLDEWWAYERGATPILRASGVTTMCGYEPSGRDTKQWARAEATHQYVVSNGEVAPGGAAPA